MRAVFLPLVATLGVAAFAQAAGAQTQSAPQAMPAPPPPPDLDQVAAVVSGAQHQLAALDGLIAAQEQKLDALYTQRDAAEEADDRDRARRLDPLIDSLNLSLTQLEAERDGMAATIATLSAQIEILRQSEQKGPGE